MGVMHDALLDCWGLPRPRELAPTSWGWNNETLFVTSAAGQHVLRVSAIATAKQVAFEHRVLGALQHAVLPFATPLPLPAADGETIVLAPSDDGVRPATLFPRISGTHLDDDDEPGVTAAAVALAQLDGALADIEVESAADTAGNLERVSPAVPSLAQIDEELGPEAADVVRGTAAAARPLYQMLPRQLIHGDFAFGNVLMDEGRVVALLDFEFSGRDLRAMEFASALGLVLTKGTRERLWRPFMRAYLKQIRLSDAEIEALPTLIRLARAISLIWWVGRQRLGLSLAEDTAARVRRLMEIDAWLHNHAPELAAELHRR